MLPSQPGDLPPQFLSTVPLDLIALKENSQSYLHNDTGKINSFASVIREFVESESMHVLLLFIHFIVKLYLLIIASLSVYIPQAGDYLVIFMLSHDQNN